MINREIPMAQPMLNRREMVLREMLPFVREAYTKAQRMMEQQAIDPKSFIHPYSADVVDKDIAWTNSFLKNHEENFNIDKANADIIETIIFQQIGQSDWLGKNVLAIKTSHFDDIRNGVDLIAEFEDERESLLHMGLAIDVTFGETALKNKLEVIRGEIKSGKLSEIKYFESARSPHKGLYQKLPRVVVGVARGHMADLMKMWVDDTKKKEMTEHPVQVMILHEIISQLICFERYAKAQGKSDIAVIYQKQKLMMEKIMRQKGNINVGTYEENDGVYTGIKKQLASF